MAFSCGHRGKNMTLTDWTSHHIKFKDCIKKQIKNIKVSEDKIIVEEKNGNIKTYLINEKLEELLAKIKNETLILVCLNNKENSKTIVNNWEKLSKYPELTIMCAEPSTNNNWSLHPETHNKITEKKSLEAGIRVLSENKK